MDQLSYDEVIYLSYEEVVEIHDTIIAETGGGAGIKDASALSSSVEQPMQNVFGQELYDTIARKAAALGFFLNANHCFQDGNKRTAYTCMDVFLRQNGYKIAAPVDSSEQVLVAVADARMTQDDFFVWVEEHVVSL